LINPLTPALSQRGRGKRIKEKKLRIMTADNIS